MSVPPQSLEDLRRSIDEIDDALLDLLRRRVGLSQSVKNTKVTDSNLWPSPLRPVREMQILKRLIGSGGAAVGPDLLVRLWRSILTESTLVQSPVTIHVGKKMAQAMGHRLRIRDHFGRFAVEEWKDDAQALMQVNANPADICIVETQSAWAEAFAAGQGGKAQVIGVLPVLREEAVPKLLVFGVAPTQATGEDETLLISKGSLPRDFGLQPQWTEKSGSYRLTCLAGYYSEHESPLVGLIRSNPGLGLKVAGRYAAPIEV
jgi:chorismate mutase / prephenate dehydratase